MLSVFWDMKSENQTSDVALKAVFSQIVRSGCILASSFLLFSAWCLPLYAEEDTITVESPLEYQVFQRRSLASGMVLIRGKVAEQGVLEFRFVGTPHKGKFASDWQTLSVDKNTGAFESQVLTPAGGWYRLELRMLRDDMPVATANIAHVGVGEVFVIAGQSNSTNYGSQRQKTSSGHVVSFNGHDWRIADDPQPGVQDGSDFGSFIPAFGDALYEHIQVPVGVACVGCGGTSVREWLPKGERMKQQPTTGAHVKAVGSNEWESTGELFGGLIQRLHQLGERQMRAILWHQGESDAGQARAGYPSDRQITGKQYADWLSTVIHASQEEAGWKVPWFVAQATYHTLEDASG